MPAVSYSSLFASLPCGICVVDCEGTILDANPALERLLGWRLSEQRGQSLSRYLEQAIADPAQALAWTVALSRALTQGLTSHLNLPADVRTGDGDDCLVSVVGVVAPWSDESAQLLGALLLLHDCSLHQDLEGARARLLSVLSHELGSPVTNIAAATDRLSRRLDGSDLAQRRLLEILRAESARLQRLLQQFLGTSPAQATPRRRTRSVVTLRPLINRVVHSFQVRETGHPFIVQAPRDLPFVWGDPDTIHEVLSNLVDNATRYTPAGTPITLAAKAREDDVLVQVIDQGQGLSPGDAKRIFGPMGQGGQEAQGVSGLGLPLCRILIRALGGELQQERLPTGENCFCFSLRRVEASIDDEKEEKKEGYGTQDPGG